MRSLNLGRIDPRRSSVAVALRIEAELAAHPPVHAAEDAAAHAHIVYFRDEIEPYALLIERILRARPAAEWFWPRAGGGMTGESVADIEANPRTSGTRTPVASPETQTAGGAPSAAGAPKNPKS